jgi:hypothetical protein
MRFELEIGDQEKNRIELYRHPWRGTLRITLNGQLVASKSPWSFFTHFNFQFVKRYEFTVGGKEKHQVTIEHERPLLFGGLRRQKYRLYVDGQLAEQHYGF